jgi:hypothetical protein
VPNPGVERQVESIRRVLRERGLRQASRRPGPTVTPATTDRVGERGLVRAIAALITHGTTSSPG